VTGIAIFVKTPGHSSVKTRLAAGIGDESAHTVYRRCAEAVASAAARAAPNAAYWATAEPGHDVAAHWPGFETIDQGAGGLGERMARVMTTLVERHGSGLLLGADAPQIDPRQLQRAMDWLRASGSRRVIGPATDGGFWTFGANDAIDPSLWTTVRYSQADTLTSFRVSMGSDGDWLELPALTDLDTANDLARVADELDTLGDALPVQRALARVLRSEAGRRKTQT